MTKAEWQAMLREDTFRWWPLITRDDLALIGLTTILGFVWYFLHWLLS